MGNKKGYIPWNKGKKGVQVAWNKGLTKETSESVMKTSQTLEGHSKFGNCGSYIRTPEIRLKNRLSQIGNQVGEKNGNWKGGISSFAYGDMWTKEQIDDWKNIRQQCYIRDGFRCQICYSKSNIQAHHTVPFRIIKEHKLEYLITLCKFHHRKVDNWLRRKEYQDIVRTANINKIAELGRNILTFVKKIYEITSSRLNAYQFN
jgi:hypothetical protein